MIVRVTITSLTQDLAFVQPDPTSSLAEEGVVWGRDYISPGLKRLRHGYVTCTSPLRGLISNTCARVLNHYKALFVATVGQLVPVAQRFSAVVCNADVPGSIPTVCIVFCCFFFPQKKIKFSTQ